MTEHIVQAFWMAGTAFIVGWVLLGLAMHQLYLYRVNRRLRSLKNLRRR